jgi:hypothetical protein
MGSSAEVACWAKDATFHNSVSEKWCTETVRERRRWRDGKEGRWEREERVMLSIYVSSKGG